MVNWLRKISLRSGCWLGIVALWLGLAGNRAECHPRTLQDELLAEGVAKLAAAARQDGDARRGAVIFFQPSLACSKCHSVGVSKDVPSLGPDLSRRDPADSVPVSPDLTPPNRESMAESIVESVLEPSKTIRKGFEPVVAQLHDGTTVTGLLQEETADTLVLKDAGRLGEVVTLLKRDIEERSTSRVSLMPTGQVNVLANRQQFLDLIRYLIDIAEGGPRRAAELQPAASQFALQLPEYEKRIDHAGFLRDLDQAAFERGEVIYQRLCINCHGTRTQAGSLPTSLKFWEGKFKNGSDPFRMYQTLTHGYQLMAPQAWMVPRQKYDVIHYLREAYLKPFNPTQYVAIDKNYLASLPKGDTRGPAPSTIEPWSSMNYGPFLMATYETGTDGSNFAHKGIAVRLDAGAGGVARGQHWQLFDHDTLRVSAAWSAAAGQSQPFIDWHGINFDGQHQIHPRIVGRLHFANPTGPGWAHPETGVWDDPRVLGRDGKRYGPLPRDWGRYRGLYQHGDQIILSYTVGLTDVLEMPGVVLSTSLNSPQAKLEPSPKSVRGTADDAQAPGLREVAPATAISPNSHSPLPIFTRTFQIGPRHRPLIMEVATHSDRDAVLKLFNVDEESTGALALLSVTSDPKTTPQVATEIFNGRTSLEVSEPGEFDWTTRDFTVTARVKTATGGTILCQAPQEGPWEPDGKSLFIRDGRLTFDVGWVGAVTGKSKITDDKWHDTALTWQKQSGRVRLYVDGKLDGEGRLSPKNAVDDQVVRLGFTSSDFPDPTYFKGQLADVRFYQSELSSHDLADLDKVSNTSLIGRWNPARGQDVVKDESGHRHNARVTRATETASEQPQAILAGLSPQPEGSNWRQGDGGRLLLELPAGNESLRFVLSVATIPAAAATAISGNSSSDWSELTTQPALDLDALTKGGPRRWPDELKSELVPGLDDGPFAADVLSLPLNNPWLAQLRLTGFDFYPDGDRVAVCTWDGDVWLVSGLLGGKSDSAAKSSEPITLTWRRIANGLFQPLGLKIVHDQIFVTCRDQLAVLRDFNGDGETDFVECFNSDHQVTEHFHEFAMGLQTDDAGNFYYAKSARHALPAVVPQHGTLLKISADGSQTEILANGFRAANGVCLNPDGTFVVTDQEGHWNPKNRINWVVPPEPGQPPRFYGNLFGYHDVTDTSNQAMEEPLCWITNAFDRSPAELLWVNSKAWGPLDGSLLNLSYGYGKVFVVPFERLPGADDRGSKPVPRVQGGLCQLPLPAFPTGIMRGRFHPTDGHLYVCGMFAWAGNATQPGGFYRIRPTGKPCYLPIGLTATKHGMEIRLSHPLDQSRPVGPKNFTVRTWSLQRTADYGSNHYDEKTLLVSSARVSDDGQTVILEIPEIAPTWCMSIEYDLVGENGEPIHGLIHNTVHQLQ